MNSPALDTLGYVVPLLWKVTWQSSVLVGLVWALQELCGKRLSAACRFALWAVVVARLLLPALPQAPLSVFNFPVMAAMPQPDALPVPTPRETIDPMSTIATAGVAPLEHVAPIEAAAVAMPTPAVVNASDPATPFSPLQGAGAVWLVGVLLLAERYAQRVQRLSGRMHGWELVNDGPARRLFDRCQEQMHVFAAVRLCATDDGLGPAVVGVLRPTIAIPRRLLESLPDEQLEHIFLHELAHVRRRDVLARRLMEAARMVHWFNPLVHFACVRMEAECELACDALVLRAIGRTQRNAYGHTLLALVEQFAPGPAMPGLVGAWTTRRRLRRRIVMIAEYEPRHRWWSLAGAALVAITALIGLTDAADMQPNAEQATASKKPAAETAPAATEKAAANASASERAGIISGSVLDGVTGKPAAGVKVCAQGIDHRGFHEVRTDERGRYRLAMLVADRYNLWATQDKRSCVAIEGASIAAGEANQVRDLELISGGFIRGQVDIPQAVLDARGKRPLLVGLHGPSRPKSGAAVESAVVQNDGTYQIRVAPGLNSPYLMSADLGDITSDPQVPVEVRAGETVMVNFRPKLPIASANPISNVTATAASAPSRVPTPAAAPTRVAVATTATPAASASAVEGTMLPLTVTLEDGAQVPLRLKLRDGYHQPLKTWENVAPGDLQLDAPKLDTDRYFLLVAAKGYALQFVSVEVKADGIKFRPKQLELPRLRYAVLRYDFNRKGKRQLKGPDVMQQRVVVTHLAKVPGLDYDFTVRQDLGEKGDKQLAFSFHNYSTNNGLAAAPSGKSYEDIDEAPANDQYKPQRSQACQKGDIVMAHLVGWRPEHQRYAKILIEDVTETPPKGMQVIDPSEESWRDPR